jgi:sugar/nucleoside kinase (ribokinase family)
MARQRTIVGLGETLLVEYSDRSVVEGLAARVAIHAVRLGHRGVVVSRIGQDAPAAELRRLLDEFGVDTALIQQDPDLPTARVIVRPIGPRLERHREERAAFDNLQADFDLVDIAQATDAVVYGLLTRRSGQTRSEENRFLAACGAALRVFDLTNRLDDTIDRGQAWTGLEHADAAVVDSTALAGVLPGQSDASDREAALALMREASLAFVVFLGRSTPSRRAMVQSAEEAAEATIPAEGDAQTAFLVALLHGVLGGKLLAQATEVGEHVAQHAVERAGEAVPRQWLD